jgi:hypothetical protein
LSRLVPGVAEPFGVGPFSGVQAFLFAAEIILDVEDAVAPEHPIPFPHNVAFVVKIQRGENRPLAGSGQIRGKSARIVAELSPANPVC